MTRRRRLLPPVVTALAVLVVVEVAVVVTLLVSPSSLSVLQGPRNAVVRLAAGDGGSPGVPERVGRAVGGAVLDWWGEVRGVPAVAAHAPPAELGFAGCSSCHERYAETRRFSVSYMDHPLHAQIGVACSTCHTDVEHPRPAPPDEGVCAGCHAEVDRPGSCDTCHPPGAIPHFYAAGYPRDALVDCSSCHPVGSISGGADPKVPHDRLDAARPDTCEACHEPTTCESCHARHPDGWRQSHGDEAAAGATDCSQCHTVTWCADSCHAVGDGSAPSAQPPPAPDHPPGVEP